MNAWTSSQGVWHQLRGGQSVGAKLVKLLLLVAIVGLLVAAVTVAYLYRQLESDAFGVAVKEELADKFRSDEVKVRGIKRDGSKAFIKGLDFIGSEAACFDKAKVRGISFNTDLLSPIPRGGNLGVISCKKLNMHLKLGGDDDQQAKAVYEAFFVDYNGLTFDRLDVADASFSWGDSKFDRGAIEGSHLTATRKGDQWSLEFIGGEFTHHWLRGLGVQKMSVVCDKTGIHVTEAHLVHNDGVFDFKADIGVAGQPDVSGSFNLKSLPLDVLLTEDYKDLIHGSISGSGQLSGYLNSKNGVLVDAHLLVGEEDDVMLYDTVPLLEALSVLDMNRSYHKVIFNDGGLNVQIAGETMTFKEVDLHSDSAVSLEGGFAIRPPIYSEIAESLSISIDDVKKAVIGDASFLDQLEDDEDEKELDEIKENRQKTVERELAYKRFDGQMTLILHGEVFKKSAVLQEAYPADSLSGKVHLGVLLRGHFSSLTDDFCKELFRLGKKRK